jgi:hypothetical protein
MSADAKWFFRAPGRAETIPVITNYCAGAAGGSVAGVVAPRWQV